MYKSKFVIMEHKALKAGLHWDLRFRLPNSKMWASFASRKKIPIEMGIKRMITRTNDHNEKEALLTGHITAGYGAGKLTKWDGGSCDIIKYEDKHIIIEFKGSKIKGIYHIISTGVMDKDFKKPTYLLFKGKVIKEGTGMISRIPAISNGDEVEEGPAEEEGNPLNWSLAEGVSNMKQYAMVCQFTAMKGFFKKKPAGDFLIMAIRDEDAFMVLQFFHHIKDNLYVCSYVGGGETSNQELLEDAMEQLRYNVQIKVLEDNIPVTIKRGAGFDFIFSRPSKYLGKKVELHSDSRLGKGYYIVKCDMKKGFKPVITYKLSDGTMGLDQAKKMRAFTSSRIKSIIGK